MNRTFDRKAYRQELIDAGFSAEDAETIASRTVMRAPRETFQSVGSMVQQATAKIERDSVQLAPPALPAPSAAVERSRRLEQEAAGLTRPALPCSPRATRKSRARRCKTRSFSTSTRT
ncbi:hypothetical protein [Onishia taeanensis]